MTPNQLPPLPEPDGQMTVTFGIDEKRKVPVFFGGKLTDYALAALAQQAQEPVAASAKDVASRALGEAAPLLYRAGHHEESGRCNAALLILEGLAVTTPQPQPAPVVPDDVARDAGWFRLIRDGGGWPAVFASHDAPEPLRGDDLDAAMIAASQQKGGQHG